MVSACRLRCRGYLGVCTGDDSVWAILIYADERANTQIGDGTRTGEDFTVHFGELMYAWAGTLVI